MDTAHVATYARVLIEAHGAEAEAVAARRMARAEDVNDHESAEAWCRIRDAIAQYKGPHQS